MSNTRRENGDGAVLPQKDGTFRIHKTVNGKRKYRRCKTEAEIEAKFKEIDKEFELENKATTLEITKISLEGYCNKVYLPYKKIQLPKHKSYMRIKSTVDNHIIPKRGMTRFLDLSTEDIQNDLNKMQYEGMSHSSVKKVFDAYNNMFNYAVDVRHDLPLEDNPMRGVIMIPQKKFKPPKEIIWFTKEDIIKLEEVATRRYKTGNLVYRYGYAYIFMINTGLREGEMCALYKSDIDREKKIIKINGTVSVELHENEDGDSEYKVHITDPKTSNSHRYVPLNQKALQCLDVMQSDFPDTPYLIYGEKKNLVRPDTFAKELKKILAAAGLNTSASTHSMRHTFASMLFEKNIDTATIAELMGDTEDVVRKTYVHLFKSRKASAVEMIDF